MKHVHVCFYDIGELVKKEQLNDDLKQEIQRLKQEVSTLKKEVMLAGEWLLNSHLFAEATGSSLFIISPCFALTLKVLSF